jgi:hypothetical protein
MKRLIWSNSRVSRSEYLFLQNASNTSGSGLTALTGASAITATYTRGQAAASVISLIASNCTAVYVSGGFSEVSQVDAPGLYRLDVPDAALATGTDKCVLSLWGAGMVPNVSEYQLDTELDFDASMGIVYRGTNALWSGSGTTNGVLGTAISGALTGVQAGDILSPVGIPPRILKTYDSSTNSWTVTTAFASSVSGVVCKVFGSAPGDSTIPVYADVVQVSGDATAADNAEAFFDGTGYAGTNNVIPTVTTVTGLLAQFPSNFSAAVITSGGTLPARVESLVSVDVKKINATTVSGSGTTASPWIGA